jgi:hypothetical protein
VSDNHAKDDFSALREEVFARGGPLQFAAIRDAEHGLLGYAVLSAGGLRDAAARFEESVASRVRPEYSVPTLPQLEEAIGSEFQWLAAQLAKAAWNISERDRHRQDSIPTPRETARAAEESWVARNRHYTGFAYFRLLEKLQDRPASVCVDPDEFPDWAAGADTSLEANCSLELLNGAMRAC